MPTFAYKAITPQGQVVKSKMDDASKLSCVRKLKRNGLTPISVSQIVTISRKKSVGNGKNGATKAEKPKYQTNKQKAFLGNFVSMTWDMLLGFIFK